MIFGLTASSRTRLLARRRKREATEASEVFSHRVLLREDNARKRRVEREASKRVGRRETRDSSVKTIGGWSTQLGASQVASVLSASL